MKGVIYVINQENLKKELQALNFILLQRIVNLSGAAKLLNDITLALGTESDEYLMAMIKNTILNRENLKKIEMEWDAEERQVWDRLIHIDQD